MKLGEPLVGQRAVASSWISFAASASGACVFILTKAHLGGTESGDPSRGAGVLQSSGVMTALPFLVLSSNATHLKAFSSLENLGVSGAKVTITTPADPGKTGRSGSPSGSGAQLWWPVTPPWREEVSGAIIPPCPSCSPSCRFLGSQIRSFGSRARLPLCR